MSKSRHNAKVKNYEFIINEMEERWILEKDEFIKTYLKVKEIPASDIYNDTVQQVNMSMPTNLEITHKSNHMESPIITKPTLNSNLMNNECNSVKNEIHQLGNVLEKYTNEETKVLKELIKKRVVEKIDKINTKILNMPYYKNYAAKSGKVHNITNHEDAVKDILISEDIGPFEIKQTKKTILKWLDNPETSNNIMPINTFIYQPCGSHESPDFIVKFADNFILAVECKSSNTLFPLYNSGGIKSNYYYIFSSNSTNKTVTYMGYNIINKEQQELIETHIKDARERDELLNKKLKELDTNHRGVCYYTRPMINQSGGGEYTNYFKHTNWENANYSVIDFVRANL